MLSNRKVTKNGKQLIQTRIILNMMLNLCTVVYMSV